MQSIDDRMLKNLDKEYILIAILGALFFIPFLGGVHLFDWDEINFAECAREMITTGDYMRPQIDYEPFWEKPPLFLWMQAASMHLFGINEFAARFPNALCGILTLLIAYHLGRTLYDRFFGWVWALAWLGSILPHLYFRSGIIDPWFNLLIFLGLYGFIKFRWHFFTLKNRPGLLAYYKPLLLGGAALGLAILTKGPTAYLITFLVLFVYFARYRFRNKGYVKHVVIFSVFAALVALTWFGIEVTMNGTWFVTEFVKYQIRLLQTADAGHGGFFGYHFVVLLLGCFPISAFAVANLWGDRQSQEEVLESDTLAACKRSDFTTLMQILFWVVLILFTLVKTKIVHYSSLAYFPLTYLGALTIWRAARWNNIPAIPGYLLPILGVLIGSIIAVVPYVGMHPEWLKPLFSKDAFALGNLEARPDWHIWQGFPGVVLILGSLAGWWYWKQKNQWHSARLALLSGAICVAFTLILYIKKIEAYSQAAAIEFYEKKSNEDCYVRPAGFKSFGHLFYTEKPPLTENYTLDDYPNLTTGTPSKKAYFVTKVTNQQNLPELPDVHELYRKNGFVFYEREWKKPE
ncbi:MAG: glycosyltransferase family 39 protein [Saprospiraceae bacterium]